MRYSVRVSSFSECTHYRTKSKVNICHSNPVFTLVWNWSVSNLTLNLACRYEKNKPLTFLCYLIGYQLHSYMRRSAWVSSFSEWIISHYRTNYKSWYVKFQFLKVRVTLYGTCLQEFVLQRWIYMHVHERKCVSSLV